MIQVNTFPSLIPRLHLRGKSLVMFGQSLGLHYYWLVSGENFPSANRIAENIICGWNTGNPWLLQNDDKQFFGTKKINVAISSQLQAIKAWGRVLVRGNLMNLMVDHTTLCFVFRRSMKHANTIWLCYISLIPGRVRGETPSPLTLPGY